MFRGFLLLSGLLSILGSDFVKCLLLKNKNGCQNKSCLNGNCIAGITCECLEGYAYNYKSTNCLPVCEMGCWNGICVAPDICVCNDGYTNLFEHGPCTPVCESGCNGGICTEPNKCKCIEGNEYLVSHGKSGSRIETARCRDHFRHRISAWVLSRT